MFIKIKKCKNCSNEYDVALATCPYCDKANEEAPKRHVPTKAMFLPYKLQIILFMGGFIGLSLIVTIVSYFVSLGNFNKTLSGTLTNTITYLILFILFIVLLFPYVKKISKDFLNWKKYLAGLIAFAIMYWVTFLAVFLLSYIQEPENSVNESQIQAMLKAYPVITFITAGVIGPIVEEITYRLGLFSFLSRINRILAYVLTALIFALIHFDFTAANLVNELLNFPSYLIGAICLTAVYDLYGFPASLTAHIANNLFALIMSLNF